MRVDLVLTGADAIRNAFRGLSSELDALNKKLDQTQARLNNIAKSAGGNGGGGSSSSTGGSSGGNTSPTTPPPVAIPPVAVPPVISTANTAAAQFKGVAVGSSLQTSGRNAANALLGTLPTQAKLAAEAVAALAVASYEASRAIREFADFSFIARGAG